MNYDKHARALQVYGCVKKALDERQWRYDEQPDRLYIGTSVTGDDLPMAFICEILEEREVARFLSMLPFDVPEDKRVDVAIAICAINNGFVNGNFDYDAIKGKIYYRRAVYFGGEKLPEQSVYDGLIAMSLDVIDRYNDALFEFIEDKTTFEELMARVS